MSEAQQINWRELASQLEVNGTPFIAGEYLQSNEGPRVNIISPVDGGPYTTYARHRPHHAKKRRTLTRFKVP